MSHLHRRIPGARAITWLLLVALVSTASASTHGRFECVRGKMQARTACPRCHATEAPSDAARAATPCCRFVTRSADWMIAPTPVSADPAAGRHALAVPALAAMPDGADALADILRGARAVVDPEASPPPLRSLPHLLRL
jgi:hypothetical protein